MARAPAPQPGVLVALLVLLGLCGCAAGGLMEERALSSGPNGPETPASLGLGFERVAIPSHGRRLDAYLVRAPASCADPPALLIYHGVNETISYWVGVQHLLYQHCVSSLVFDPTGSGDSSRPASIQRVDEDASSAYAFARAQFAPDVRLFVLGHSLGDAELLQAAPAFTPPPSGIVLANAFSSLRRFWRDHGGGPLLPRMMPDLWDNVRAVKTVRAPVLVIHSDADKVTPLAEAMEVYTAAPQPKSMVVLHGLAHNELRRRPSEAFWGPVLKFMESPGRAGEPTP